VGSRNVVFVFVFFTFKPCTRVVGSFFGKFTAHAKPVGFAVFDEYVGEYYFSRSGEYFVDELVVFWIDIFDDAENA
jgi:hypothetical protein